MGWAERIRTMDHRMKIAEQKAGVAGAQCTRVVVVDIETVAIDTSNDKGALDAMTGRIVCIGMLMDDGQIVTEITLADEDERRLITEFWRSVAPSDVLAGHNVLD